MAGNVSEWSADWYDEGKKDLRLLRGGSWNDTPEALRVSNRNWSVAVDRCNGIGFRLAQDIP